MAGQVQVKRHDTGAVLRTETTGGTCLQDAADWAKANIDDTDFTSYGGVDFVCQGDLGTLVTPVDRDASSDWVITPTTTNRIRVYPDSGYEHNGNPTDTAQGAYVNVTEAGSQVHGIAVKGTCWDIRGLRFNIDSTNSSNAAWGITLDNLLARTDASDLYLYASDNIFNIVADSDHAGAFNLRTCGYEGGSRALPHVLIDANDIYGGSSDGGFLYAILLYGRIASPSGSREAHLYVDSMQHNSVRCLWTAATSRLIAFLLAGGQAGDEATIYLNKVYNNIAFANGGSSTAWERIDNDNGTYALNITGAFANNADNDNSIAALSFDNGSASGTLASRTVADEITSDTNHRLKEGATLRGAGSTDTDVTEDCVGVAYKSPPNVGAFASEVSQGTYRTLTGVGL